jgi:uncharacterized RDD family membrane protein YckC
MDQLMSVLDNQDSLAVGPLRRLMAGMYDWLLILALAIIGSLPVVFFYGESVPTGNPAYQAALLALSIVYLTYCWTRSGQTPGMKTWNIRITTKAGGRINAKQCLLHFTAAFISFATMGMGFWWAWTNRERSTWHDLWSETRLQRTPKR